MESKLTSIQKTLRDGFNKVLKLKTLKRSSGGAPTEPQIMKTSHTVKVNEEVFIDTVPKGMLNCWEEGYKVANTTIAREKLCLSKSVRWHN